MAADSPVSATHAPQYSFFIECAPVVTSAVYGVRLCDSTSDPRRRNGDVEGRKSLFKPAIQREKQKKEKKKSRKEVSMRCVRLTDSEIQGFEVFMSVRVSSRFYCKTESQIETIDRKRFLSRLQGGENDIIHRGI